MKTARKRKKRTRPVPLDESQSAVAIFAAALGITPRHLPTTKAARKVRTTKFKVKRP
jgi:hypothetical protein